MSTQIPGIPQTATGVSLTNHINDRLRRISLALGAGGSGSAGATGATGAAGAPAPVSTAVTRRGKPVMFGTRAASQTFSDFAGNHLSIDMNGAVADCLTVTDAAMSASSDPTHLGSASAGFTVLNIGMPVLVVGAGASGAGLQGTIVSISSPAVAVLSVSCLTTVTGAQATWGTDNTAAINAVLTTAAAINADVQIPPGTYLITGTITLYPHTRVWGTWGGTPLYIDDSGSTLFYAGPPNTNIVSAVGLAGLVWSGVSINGGNNAISGCTGIYYDAATGNNPISEFNTFEAFSIYNVGLITYGGVSPSTAMTAIDGVAFQFGDSGALGYQSAQTWIARFEIYSVRTGFAFNSYNTAQCSSIRDGSLGQIVYAFDLILQAGLLSVDTIASGGLIDITGSASAFIHVGALEGPVTFKNVQEEEGYGYFLHAPSTANSDFAITLDNCSSGGEILIETGAYTKIVSRGCYYDFDVHANVAGSTIISTGDAFLLPGLAIPLPYGSAGGAGTCGVTNGSNAVQFNQRTPGLSSAPLVNGIFNRGIFSPDSQTITAATNANPAVFTVTAAPTTGTAVYVNGGALSTYWGEVNGPQIATKIDATHFSIAVDSTAFGPIPPAMSFALTQYIITATSNTTATINKIVSVSTTPATLFTRVGAQVTLTVGAGLGLTFGNPIQAISTLNGAQFFRGTVASYSGTTLVINVIFCGGDPGPTQAPVTLASWYIVGIDPYSGTTNAAQAWAITSAPIRAFLDYPFNGFTLLDPPLWQLPGAVTETGTQTLTNKHISSYGFGFAGDDTLGNLPATWPLSQTYTLYVAGIPTFPGTTFGIVKGYNLCIFGIWGFQTYYDAVNTYFRQANPSTAQTVIAATNANPVVIEVATAPATGITVQFGGAGGIWGTICNVAFIATKIDATHFSIPVNTLGWGAVIGTLILGASAWGPWVQDPAFDGSGDFEVPGLLQVGNASGGSGTSGDIVARRSANTGAYYFGDSASAYLYFDGTNFNFSGGQITTQSGGTGNTYASQNALFAALLAAYVAGTGAIPPASGGTGVTSIAALFALLTGAEVSTAIGSAGYTGTLAAAITAGKSVVNGIIQP